MLIVSVLSGKNSICVSSSCSFFPALPLAVCVIQFKILVPVFTYYGIEGPFCFTNRFDLVHTTVLILNCVLLGHKAHICICIYGIGKCNLVTFQNCFSIHFVLGFSSKESKPIFAYKIVAKQFFQSCFTLAHVCVQVCVIRRA